MTLADIQAKLAALPRYSPEPQYMVIQRKYYNMMIHRKYQALKAVRKAKVRKKRINARCGRP